MPRIRLAAVALAASALIASGCGSSTKSSTPTSSSASTALTTANQVAHTTQSSSPSAPLTRAQLIEKGDAICYRLNARRQSTTLAKRSEYEQIVLPLSVYETKGATELSELTPPPSMAHSWRQIVTDAHTIAEVTGHYRHYGEANHKEQHPYDAMLGNAINQIVAVAKREGFKECSRFL